MIAVYITMALCMGVNLACMFICIRAIALSFKPISLNERQIAESWEKKIESLTTEELIEIRWGSCQLIEQTWE